MHGGNVLGFASPGEAAPYQKQITRDVVLDGRSPDCEDILKDLIWAFSDFARDRRGVRDPEARYLAGNPRYPGSTGPVLKAQFSRFTPFANIHKSHKDILTMLTTTSHDSVLLRADDPPIDMNYITSFTGMTDKWFYKPISEGHFLNPSNWGVAAAGTKVKWSSGCSKRIEGIKGLHLFRISIIS